MDEHIKEDLQHIRQMMEQSSRFLSLSGLSGVVAGVAALAGAVGAWFILRDAGVDYFSGEAILFPQAVVGKLVLAAVVVLIAALGLGALFTLRKNKKLGLKMWTGSTRKVLQALAIPLVAGGIFCLALINLNYFVLVAPATLMFYGLALVQASRYTYNDIEALGYCEILLGSVAMFVPGYGLVFWALGFGVLHIVYGLLVYTKYK